MIYRATGIQQCKGSAFYLKNKTLPQKDSDFLMKYADFEKIMSSQRMERYLTACGRDTRKAMTLYRYNLQISQEMFTIVSCFEVALRNAIDRKLTENLGEEWAN